MFKLNEKSQFKRNILNCDFIGISPFEITTINTAYSQININIHRKDYGFCLLNSYLDLYFGDLHTASNDRYAVANDLRLINLDPSALFKNYILKNSSGQH